MPKQYGTDEHRPERTILVRAWVLTVNGERIEVDGDAVAWTKRAVRTRLVDRFGYLDHAWVWVGAVTRR
ncbi:hypothetical protein [Cellulomonas sp. GbtcB1]|uniref:hypothetical protein n=1 Tax=Cellulomonas sp. GbtcB1 TaxID=2824746 RepID=UPI0020C6FA8B|nr:hypothetical protein [Cellulomonas sp. GbtcB1]